jgi:hypothetical protein
MDKGYIDIQEAKKEDYDDLREIFFNSRLETIPLTLKCVTSNKNALNFYLSQGWTIEEEVTETESYYLMKYIGRN